MARKLMSEARRPRSNGLRIVLDARLPPGAWGGVQQVVEGLASGLAAQRGDDEFIFVTRGDATWLDTYLGGPARRVTVSDRTGEPWLRRASRAASPRRARVGSSFVRSAPALLASWIPIPRSDGFIESLDPDLVHFLLPQAVLTPVPSIYQPHDLLHLHRPEDFAGIHRNYRDRTYREFARRASIVGLMTEWARADAITRLGLDRTRVAVVPWAPVVGLRQLRTPVNIPALPTRFILYPAQTWPHKNHVRLLEALDVLNRRGCSISLICTGRQTHYFQEIERHVLRLGLNHQVQFLGYVEDAVLAELYRKATAVVFPSLFEGWGLPVVEAFAMGVPVAASNATALPEVAAGAALLFDPESVDAIADAIFRIWSNESLRRDLADRGLSRAQSLSWETTAATFVALYKKVVVGTLSDADRALLQPPTLLPAQ